MGGPYLVVKTVNRIGWSVHGEGANGSGNGNLTVGDVQIDECGFAATSDRVVQ